MYFSRRSRSLAVAVALACATSLPSPAQAAIHLDFIQSGPSVGGNGEFEPPALGRVTFSGRMTIDDNAYFYGFEAGFTRGAAGFPQSWLMDAVIDLTFTVTGERGEAWTTTRQLIFDTGENSIAGYSMKAAGGNAAAVVGAAAINSSNDDFDVSFDKDGFRGGISSDGQFGCYYSRCMFGGAIAVSHEAPTAVPEPGTLALLAAGVVGLAGVRRRWR